MSRPRRDRWAGPARADGVLGLAGVILVHELAEVVIIANGIRAARHRTPSTDHRPGSPVAASYAVGSSSR